DYYCYSSDVSGDHRVF
nr:immunoglobulin light chain junction region [Macaca mulatta]MOV74078.1 immunoglobulin light chain junction region [Macaca mulatta]